CKIRHSATTMKIRLSFVVIGVLVEAALAFTDLYPNEEPPDEIESLAFDSENPRDEPEGQAIFRKDAAAEWCVPKQTCKEANGFCIKDSSSCTGSIIEEGCTGKDCVCCVNDNNCPNGFYRVGTECFKVFQQLAGWDEARHKCQRHGWELAEPEDMSALAKFIYDNVSYNYFWIGGRGVGGSFKYVSGQSIQDDAPWGIGSDGNKDDLSHCLILRSTNTTYTTTLTSYDCYKRYHFICEPGCPEGFIRSADKCFKVVTRSQNWEDSERNCYAEGLQIAEPEDPKSLAKMLYNGIGGQTYRSRYWLGARGGRIDGSTIAWNSGEPVPNPYPINNTWHSNYPRYNTSSYCLQMYTYYYEQGPMYELSCTSSYYSLCELSCPSGFFHIGNQCYKAYSSSASSWTEAREMCNHAHLTLAEPLDPFAVADYLFTVTGHHNYWLGGKGDGSKFRWSSGEIISVNWASWHPGHPGNMVGMDYCLRLAPEYRTTPLMSTTCSTQLYPLCQ
ncbi:unnamed protein product, partial [Meganyctiphanes norvegica]